MKEQPIENYGIIGNMYTTALVGLNGSIDWLCFPPDFSVMPVSSERKNSRWMS